MISQAQVKTYLERIRQVASTELLTDVHVHPFDIMSPGQIIYTGGDEGIYASGKSPYSPPSMTMIAGDTDGESPETGFGSDMQRRMALFHSRKIYSHTGPGVLADQMSLAGIRRMLLLPVAGPYERGLGQMELLWDMFRADERYALALCVPNDVPNDKIGSFVDEAMELYDLVALKVHPNITGLDLSTFEGMERLENLLSASSESGLKVFVHGGHSPDYLAPGKSSLAAMENLKNVAWSLTDQPVVISHAGCFGITAEEATKDILPVLNGLMDRFDNLLIDTSGVGMEVLGTILSHVDRDRTLFGSDALYFPVWSTVVTLFHLLEKNFPSPEEEFLRIAGSNSLKFIFPG